MKGRSRNLARHLLTLASLPVSSAVAQQALNNLIAGDQASQSRQQFQALQRQDYTVKSGDFRLLVVPSLGLEYSDNVNLAQTNVLDDYLVMPNLDVTASYPLTQQNVISLDLSGGYNYYVKHPDFSTFTLNSATGTGLSLDVVIKDFTIDIHDRVHYSQGVSQNGGPIGSGYTGNSVNGSIVNTATYGTLQNTAGLLGTWDLNQVTLSAGYDHQIEMSTDSQYDAQDQSSELVSARAGLRVHPEITTGLETTATYTSYDQQSLNDSDAYTIGPYLQFTPDQTLNVTARGGYTIYDFQNTSTVIHTSGQSSWYADVDVTHKITRSISYSLSAGRETQLGAVTDLLQDWYVRPNATFTFIKGLTFTLSFFYEHGNQGVGSTGSLPNFPNSNGTFDWYGGGLSVQHALTDRFWLGLNYQYTMHSSDIANATYRQNMVSLQLSYHPK